MVSPAHIREAEKFGMPVVEPEVLRCRQCDAKRKDDDIDKCDDCGRECCPKCWVWIPDVALRFCSESCARTRLLKLLAAAEMNERPITEHPDVQRLIGQVAELQIKFHELQDENVELQDKNERLSKRDCNATVQILLPTADSPFNKEDCRIVDVGYSDNIYVVECDAVVELQAENKRLKNFVQRVSDTYATGGDPEEECELCRGELQYSAKQVLKGK